MTNIDFPTIRWIDAFGAGIYVLTALTQLDLWLHRRDRSTHLWLGLSALGALLVNLSGQVIRMQRPNIQHWPLVINLFGVVLALISLFELTQAITHRRSAFAARSLQALAVVLVLGVATLRYDPLVPMLHLLSLGFLLWAMMHAVGDGLRGDIEARSLAIGLIVLLATLIFDILGAMGVLPRLEGIPVFGFALLFLAAARTLSMRYDREYRELVALRAELEARVHRRTAELEHANQQLDLLSRTDALTGLPNRRSFIDSATQAVAQQQRTLQPLSIVMIDVDHFKRVNDDYGHAAGDAALRSVADSLRRGMRLQDVVARWGGEEFIVMVPETDRDGATIVAEQLRHAISAMRFAHDGHSIAITASFGVAQHDAGQGLDATIVAADRVLYLAKQRGRNRVEVA